MDEDAPTLDEGGLCARCQYEVGAHAMWDGTLIGTGCIATALKWAEVEVSETRLMNARIQYRLGHYFHHRYVTTCPLCVEAVVR